MARKKETPKEATQDESKPKRRVRKKKEVILPCWEVCSKGVVHDGTDYVHICLGNVFVTHTELARMMGGTNQKETV